MKVDQLKRVEELQARDVMSSPAIACREQTRLEEVAEVLADREVSGLPVLDAEDRLVGVISERDIAHALGGPLMRLAIRRPVHSGSFLRTPHSPAQTRLARDVMTSPAICVEGDALVAEVAALMVTRHVNRVPVVDHDHLTGVITRDDLLAAVAGLAGEDREVRVPIVLGSGMENAARSTSIS